MKYLFWLFIVVSVEGFSQSPTSADLKKLKIELKTALQVDNFNTIIQKHLAIGKIYGSNGLYSNALEHYNAVIKRYQIKEKDSIYVKVNNFAGGLYTEMRKYDNATSYFNEALQTSKKINHLKGQAESLSLLGATCEKKGEYLKALDYENKSLSFLNQEEDKFQVAKVYENIGSIYEDLMQYDEAYKYFNKSYEIVRNSFSNQEANVLNNLGDVYRKKGNVKKGLEYTNKSLEIANKLNDKRLLESANKDLAKSYALLENYKMAYNYRLEAEDYREQVLLAENKNQVNVLQADFEINQKEVKIHLLEEQNKFNEIRFVLLLVISVAIIVIMVLLYVYYRKKRLVDAKIQALKEKSLQSALDKKKEEEKSLQHNLELKNAALSRYSLQIAQKNKLLYDLSVKLKNIGNRKLNNYETPIKELSSEIDFTLQQDNEWEDFNVFFEEIHPHFIKNLSEIAIDKLSPTELKLGILLRLNLSSKEIASILRVTPDSVRVARYRFRKKLPIDSKAELVSFLLEL